MVFGLRLSATFLKPAASVASSSVGARARGWGLNLHCHDEKGQPVPRPAAQPGDLPITEPRANCIAYP